MSDQENSYAGKVISTSNNDRNAQIVVFGIDARGKRISTTHHARHEGGNTYSFPIGDKNELGDYTTWDVINLRS